MTPKNSEQHREHHHHDMTAAVAGLELTDPVCGMRVTESSPHHIEHGGKPIYFCSAKCMGAFNSDPDKFIQKDKSEIAIEQTAPGTIYTCPMHPEIQQDHPGSCPKCGMALEPLMPSLEDDNPELKDFTRRFWWTLPFTVIVTVLAMFGHQLPWFSMATQTWVELVLSLPVVLWAGQPFFVRGWQSVINRSPNMWTLIGLGTAAAFVYSVMATVTPGLFPETFMRRR